MQHTLSILVIFWDHPQSTVLQICLVHPHFRFFRIKIVYPFSLKQKLVNKTGNEVKTAIQLTYFGFLQRGKMTIVYIWQNAGVLTKSGI